jgi:hypothetical protein
MALVSRLNDYKFDDGDSDNEGHASFGEDNEEEEEKKSEPTNKKKSKKSESANGDSNEPVKAIRKKRAPRKKLDAFILTSDKGVWDLVRKTENLKGVKGVRGSEVKSKFC